MKSPLGLGGHSSQRSLAETTTRNVPAVGMKTALLGPVHAGVTEPKTDITGNHTHPKEEDRMPNLVADEETKEDEPLDPIEKVRKMVAWRDELRARATAFRSSLLETISELEQAETEVTKASDELNEWLGVTER